MGRQGRMSRSMARSSVELTTHCVGASEGGTQFTNFSPSAVSSTRSYHSTAITMSPLVYVVPWIVSRCTVIWRATPLNQGGASRRRLPHAPANSALRASVSPPAQTNARAPVLQSTGQPSAEAAPTTHACPSASLRAGGGLLQPAAPPCERAYSCKLCFELPHLNCRSLICELRAHDFREGILGT